VLGRLLLGMALSLPLLSANAQSLESPPIRVRLETAVSVLELEGLGIQVRGRDQSIEPVAIPQKQKIRISRQTGPRGPVWKVLRNGSEMVLTDRFLALKAIDLRHNGKLLPNQVFLGPRPSLKFDVVGILPLEDYLVGVIASEMPLSWPLQTLKAQAIAARSYALATMRERSRQLFHVESTILDQVFKHIGRGPDKSPLIAKAKEAVRQTQGLVLKAAPQKVLKAFYHSDCGGKTTNARAVWGFGSREGSRIDSSCPSNPHAHWAFQISRSELSARLAHFLGDGDLGQLQSLEALRPGPRERAERIRLIWDSGEIRTVSANELRSAVGFEQLRSALFEIESQEGEFLFKGRGFGHGVGLCQWGARSLGTRGKSYREILAHYYPQARLENLEFRIPQKLEARKEEPHKGQRAGVM
jgi:stage II sporulation protein D